MKIIKYQRNSKVPAEKWKDYPEHVYGDSEIDNLLSKGYNYGILTGKASGITVIDVDCEGLSKWERISKIVKIETLTVQSPSGGIHLYFDYDIDIPNGQVFEGIEIKNDGMQITGPGSSISKKKYEIIREFPKAPIPSALKEIIFEKKKARPLKEQIFKGARNEHLFKYGCKLLQSHDEERVAKFVQLENLEKCNPPLHTEEVERICESVFTYREERTGKHFSIFEDVEDFVEKYREHVIGEERVPVGYENLNRYITGWRKKSIYTIIGGTGMGKSMYLANLGIQSCLLGSDVVLFTLEMETYAYAARIYSILTGIPVLDLAIPGIEERIARALTIRKTKEAGHLYIIDYSPKEVDVHTLSKDIQDLDVDFAVVDYAELLSTPTKRKDAYYLEINEIFYGLKAIAKDLDIPILTAAQMNRSGYGRYGGSEEFVGMSTVQGSMGITQVSDVVFSISLSTADKESGKSALQILKNRYGPADVFLQFNVDYAKSKIEDGGYITEMPKKKKKDEDEELDVLSMEWRTR